MTRKPANVNFFIEVIFILDSYNRSTVIMIKSYNLKFIIVLA